MALNWVVSAAQALTLRPESDQPTTRSIAVDSVLAYAISRQVDCEEQHSLTA